jgi:hypothetical protein
MSGRSATFDQLSKEEARALLQRYVAGRETQLAVLGAEMQRSGSPTVDLNFDRSSLVGLWAWFLASQTKPRKPATDEEMRATDPPWWYDFYAPLGKTVGPSAGRLVSPIAAYLSEAILRARPASKWTLGTGRDDPGLERAPVLAVAGGRRFLPDAVVLTYAARWARGESTSAEVLSFLFGIYTGIPVASVRPVSSAPYSISRGRPNEFETEIVFDDEVAADSRIDDLVEQLAPVAGIERVIREDREVVLVRAPSIDDSTLQSTVDRLWREVASRTTDVSRGLSDGAQR